MKQSRSSTKLGTGANVRRDGLPESKPGAAPLFEALEQRLLLSAVPFVDDLIDAYPVAEFPAAAEQGQSFAEQVRTLAEKHAAGELKPGEDFAVDDVGNVVFYDPLPEASADDLDVMGGLVVPGGLPETPGTAPFDLNDTFLLHSNPTATKTLYLDFDGHTTTTGWNGGVDFTTPAYNFEGGTGVFTDAEKTRIQKIWERVVEDFIPFDVDVTTQEPAAGWLVNDGGADEHWGQRVVIGGTGAWYGSAGGVAHFGSFDAGSDDPCFVFSASYGGGEKGVAETISHEAGHTVGLGHDGQVGGTVYYAGHGSGETGWAPIMGRGTGKELVQWSKGEYGNANNQQYDINIITTTNGFGFRADDHGDDDQTATTLAMSPGAMVFDSGIIEQESDVDFFSFTTQEGTVNLFIDPFYRSPNLDILATLYDSNGTPITSDNLADELEASFSEYLTAGTYFLSVEGTGKSGSYSDYASLGQYTITGNIIQPGVSIAETGGDTIAFEGGNVDTYDISLNTVPSGSVEITATADSQTEVSLDGTNFSSSVVFSRSDRTVQTITVRAINDAVGESNHTGTISHAITATNDTTDYPTSIVMYDVLVTIIDDDVELIIDNQDAGATFVGDWSYNDNKPGFYGTDYHHDGDDDKGNKSFTFTPTLPHTGIHEVLMQWSAFSNRASNVPVDINHDGGTTTVFVDQTANGGDFNSLGFYFFTAATGSVTIRTTGTNGYVIADAVTFEEPTDPGISVLATGGGTDVVEGAATDTYDIVLHTAPTGSVEVTVTADAQSEVSLDGTNFASSQVLFFSDTTAQTVTVRAIDDAVEEGAHTATLTHAITASSDTTNYPTSMTISDVTVNITDNDGTIDIIVDNQDANVSKVGTWDYNPNVAGFYGTDYHHDQNSGKGTKSFTFEPSIPITGSYEVFMQWSSSGNRASNVPVDINHDGGTTTVTIDQTTGGGAFNSLGTFTFTASTGSVTIRTTGTNGYVIADAVRFLEAGPPAPAVAINESSGSTDVVEGGATDTYDIALTTTPAGSVQVTVTADAESEVSLDGTNFASSQVLTFTDTTGQTVTVRAIDDVEMESSHTATLTHAITATNDTTDYPTSTTIADVTVNITDNDASYEEIIDNLDSAKLTIVGSWSANPNVAGFYGTDYHHDQNSGQGSKTFTFTPSLPTTKTYEVFMQWSSSGNRASNVPVDINHDGGTTTVTVDQTTGGGVMTSLGTFTFTASTGSVTIRTTGANGYVIADAVKFVETGSVAPAVSITQSGGSTDVAEGGAADTYDIVLTTDPADSVDVTVTADAQSEVSLDGTNFASSQVLTFTDRTAQTVTVRAIDDAVDEGNHTSTLTHAITTTNDPTDYPTSMSISDVTVNITDDDGPIEIIVDNQDSANVTMIGDWGVASAKPGFIGTDYHHDKNIDKGKTFTFTPDITVSGTYDVYMQWSADANRATNVVVGIFYDGDNDVVVVDQTTNGGQWNLLGTYDFVATMGYVRIYTNETNGYVIADAIRLVEVVPAPGPMPLGGGSDDTAAVTVGNSDQTVNLPAQAVQRALPAGTKGQPFATTQPDAASLPVFEGMALAAADSSADAEDLLADDALALTADALSWPSAASDELSLEAFGDDLDLLADLTLEPIIRL